MLRVRARENPAGETREGWGGKGGRRLAREGGGWGEETGEETGEGGDLQGGEEASVHQDYVPTTERNGNALPPAGTWLEACSWEHLSMPTRPAKRRMRR